MLKRFLLVLVTSWISWGQIPQQLQIQAPPPSMVVGGNGVVVGGLGNSTHYYWIVAVYPIGSMVSNQGIYVRQAPDTLSSTNYITVSWSPVLGATSYTVLRTIQNKIPVGACGCMKVTGLTTTTYNDISNTRNAFNVPLNILPSLGTISIDNIGTLSPTHASTNVPQTIFNLPLINNIPANQITFSDGTVQSTAASGGGSGTVTNIATTAPITGGPITTTGTIACATCTTNASALTLNLPVIGAGGQATAVGTRQGNTTAFVTYAGSAPTTNDCAKFDVNGNITTTGGGCVAGTVTSIGLLGTANQVTVTGASPITTSGSWTLSLPASISGVTNLTPGADFTLTQNAVNPFTIVSSGAIVNTLTLSSGMVGVNTIVPVTNFTVTSTSTASPRGITSSQFTTDTLGARTNLRKARGSEASPTTVVTGDNMGGLNGWGYDGTNFLEMATITMGVEGTIAATRVPTNIKFSTATDAAPSVLTERMRIASNGNVGIGTTGPLNKLSVSSTVAADGISLDGSSAPAISLHTNGVLRGYAPAIPTSNGQFFASSLTGDLVYRSESTGRVLLGVDNGSGTSIPIITLSTIYMGVGLTTPSYSLDVSRGVGTNGTARFFDQTATTGTTRVVISLGAADSNTTTVFTISGVQKFAGQNSTGAGSALLGTNSPAGTLTAPYTWITVTTSDGSTAYMPVWK